MSPTKDDVDGTRERLLDMMVAYKSTYLLRTAVELRVFDCLSSPLDSGRVAAAIGADPRATRILLDALVANSLVLRDGELYSLSADVRRLLVSTSPEYFGGNTFTAASDWEWDTMRHLADVVRAGGPIGDAAAEQPDFPFWVDFATNLTGLTKASAGFLAEAVAVDHPQRILDVGSGPGVFGLVAARHPESQVWLQDWPAVLAVAERRAHAMNLADRTRLIAGDAFEVPLGGPYDLIIVANLLLQFSAERSVQLLRRLVSVLADGGRIVIAGFTAGDAPPHEQAHAHMLGLLMLAGTSGGELHSSAAYQKMLATAGLVGVHERTHPRLPVRLIIGDHAKEA
jgi:C-methyltransferase